MNRFANTTTCDWCKRITVHATKWTRFTNLFKRPRIIRINRYGPTPGLNYPGEKVKMVYPDHLLLPNLVSCSVLCWCQQKQRPDFR